jgi:hypothetical protein
MRVELSSFMSLPRSKRTWALLIAALTAFLIVLVFILQPNEPAYKGKPLGYWLDQLPATLRSTNGAITQVYPIFYNTIQEGQTDEERVANLTREAKEAVDALGTNCLRTLVARLGCTDSRAKLFAQRWALRLGLLNPRRILTPETRRGQALTALGRMDSRAKSIVPDLLALTKSNDSGVSAAARHALWSVAPNEYRRLEEQGRLTKK